MLKLATHSKQAIPQVESTTRLALSNTNIGTLDLMAKLETLITLQRLLPAGKVTRTQAVLGLKTFRLCNVTLASNWDTGQHAR